MARSQMEIMGLVIVMVLITLGILMVVEFVILKQPTNLKEKQSQSQLASNFLSTFLQTTTDCSNFEMRVLIQNCFLRKDEKICPYLSGKITACQYAKNVTKLILKDTLLKWNTPFNLSISDTGINFSRGDCSGAKEAKFAPITAGSNIITVDLEICRPGK